MNCQMKRRMSIYSAWNVSILDISFLCIPSYQNKNNYNNNCSPYTVNIHTLMEWVLFHTLSVFFISVIYCSLPLGYLICINSFIVINCFGVEILFYIGVSQCSLSILFIKCENINMSFKVKWLFFPSDTIRQRCNLFTSVLWRNDFLCSLVISL